MNHRVTTTTDGDARSLEIAACPLEAWVTHALSGCNMASQVDVRIMGEEEMRALNRDFRGQDKPTNVLAFPALDPGWPDVEGPQLLGDIALCAPVLIREALAQGKSVEHHAAHLVIHGVLHLLGYDHQESAAAAAMEAHEVQLLDQIGISDPYQPSVGAAGDSGAPQDQKA